MNRITLISLGVVVLASCQSSKPISPEPSAASPAGSGGIAGAAGSDAAGQAGAPFSGGAAGVAGSGIAGQAGGPLDPSAFRCPSDKQGPPLVFLSTPDGHSFCIDRTEVTVAQYMAFIDSKPDVSAQELPRCKENKTFFGPTKELQEPAFKEIDPKSRPDEPMRMVDWCDAYAYCKWVGKRLCGKVGGGSVDPIGEMNSVASEWYFACTNGGKTKYPYGDQFDAKKCSVEVEGKYPFISVSDERLLSCTGAEFPFNQILGLSGGVFEWENTSVKPELENSPSFSAGVRGGAWGSSEAASG